MEIKIGVYTIHSDSCTMWITETVSTKDKKGNTKEYEQRVAGYVPNWHWLLENFMEKAYRRSGAKEVRELLRDMDKRDEDIRMLIRETENFRHF